MDDYQKYLDKAIYFLKFRPRSEKEVRDSLLKKKAPPAILEQVITWLKEQQFLNDEEFAKWWIEQRTKFRPKGERLIKLELRQKGVAQEVIDSVFSNQESGIRNQGEQVKKLVERKIDKYKGLPKREIYQKLGAFLGRRGFDWETIKKGIDEVFTNRV